MVPIARWSMAAIMINIRCAADFAAARRAAHAADGEAARGVGEARDDRFILPFIIFI